MILFRPESELLRRPDDFFPSSCDEPTIFSFLLRHRLQSPADQTVLILPFPMPMFEELAVFVPTGLEKGGGAFRSLIRSAFRLGRTLRSLVRSCALRLGRTLRSLISCALRLGRTLRSLISCALRLGRTLCSLIRSALRLGRALCSLIRSALRLGRTLCSLIRSALRIGRTLRGLMRGILRFGGAFRTFRMRGGGAFRTFRVLVRRSLSALFSVLALLSVLASVLLSVLALLSVLFGIDLRILQEGRTGDNIAIVGLLGRALRTLVWFGVSRTRKLPREARLPLGVELSSVTRGKGHLPYCLLCAVGFFRIPYS